MNAIELFCLEQGQPVIVTESNGDEWEAVVVCVTDDDRVKVASEMTGRMYYVDKSEIKAAPNNASTGHAHALDGGQVSDN